MKRFSSGTLRMKEKTELGGITWGWRVPLWAGCWGAWARRRTVHLGLGVGTELEFLKRLGQSELWALQCDTGGRWVGAPPSLAGQETVEEEDQEDEG
jgi:hypothetical protein